MTLSFYEDNGFYDKTNKRLTYDDISKIQGNLYVDNIEAYFGFDISNLTDDNNNFV